MCLGKRLRPLPFSPLPHARQCEDGGSSFVTGFSQAERVVSYYFDVYYPVGKLRGRGKGGKDVRVSTARTLPLLYPRYGPFSQCHVPSLIGYLQVGQVECCTPVLLMSSGEMWEINRCKCYESETKVRGKRYFNCWPLFSLSLGWGITASYCALPCEPLSLSFM